MTLLTDPFTRSLACTAISPGLRSVIVFDATPEKLKLTAQIYSQMLEVVTNYSVPSVTLATYETDDELWGSFGLYREDGCQGHRKKVGMVSPHLLDRFAIRLVGEVAQKPDRVAEIKELIEIDFSKGRGKEKKPQALPD